MAIEKLITDHLDLWTAAVRPKSSAGRGSNSKLELTGIKKLRELILELAVRGKLVPQDPSDEPASVLLERIAAEKARLVNAGKNKKSKGLPVISDEEIPFQLPEGWAWIRFGNIYELEYGDNLPQPARTNSGEFSVFGSNGVVGTHSVASVHSPCIVIGRKGSAGALNLSDALGCWVTDVAYSCIPPLGVDIKFAFKQMHTLGLDCLGKGIKPGLNRNEAYELVVALPPLVEQHRIVAKVDELMSLCDQLEQQSEVQLASHQTLVEALLATLTDSTNAEELAQNWARLAQHFDTLFITEASIDALKQTILQLAVMGKLVPQDPTDEPASALLERIAAEKAQLVKEKKIKKEKPLPPISKEEKLFALPDGWMWCRLNDIIKISSGDGLTSKQMTPNGAIPVFGGNGITGYHDQHNVTQPTLVIGRVGYYCGSVHITPNKAWVTDNAFITQFSLLNLDLNFLAWLLKATDLNENDNATAQPVISGRKLYPIAVCLPPLAEQVRIVTKIDELMSLCEQLKARLQTSQQTQLALAEALVEGALD